MNKLTNIVVQLMPLVLVFASVFYYALGATVFSVTAFVLGILFYAVVYNDVTKSADHDS